MFCEAETVSGRILGIDHGPVLAFKGVPYGASTTGEKRFMPPCKLPPWTGVMDCLGFGPASPQAPPDPRNSFANLLQFNMSATIGGMSEDCLRLNIWTPSLRDNNKRPVLVSLHGGAFLNGSSNLPFYDGSQLAIRGDVVVVNVNHRLNVFGHLNLIGTGAPERFAGANVAGLLDLVAALEWVRDNIEVFGGDPSRVTIFGQSGGGWKTSCLLAMPAAQGLFARAAIQSGSLLRVQTKEESATIAAAFLSKLGIEINNIDSLQKLSWVSVLKAAAEVGLHLFQPSLDDDFLPRHPFSPDMPPQARDIPIIIGTTLDDAAFLHPNMELGEDEMRELLASRYGEKGSALVDLYRLRWPAKTPYLLLGQIVTDAGFRRFAHAQAEQLAMAGDAPIFAYQWNWQTPGFDGVFGAAHATDVPASLYNVHDPLLGAGSRDGIRLADQLSQAFINFAKNGIPGSSLAAWPPFDLEKRTTMIFDQVSQLADDPDAEIRKFWCEIPMAPSVFG